MMSTYSRKMAGFTMVELMVSVALSSFVVLSIGSLFASNSQTLRLQTALNDVNESGRYALVRMTRDVRMLGFRATGYEVPSALDDALVPEAGDSDVLSLKYEAPYDCNRTAVGPSGVITNRYEVIDDSLVCNAQILARDVEEMRIFLGEDLDGDKIPNRFVLANTPGLSMGRVVSLRIDLLVRSPSENVNNSGHVFHSQWNKELTDDKRLRHEYSVTVALRNRM